MRWDQIVGHQQQFDWFQTAVAQRRLGSTFLFVGREGIGKRTFARMLAQGLLCRQTPVDQLTPCYQCEDCVQVQASTHPDLIELAKPAEKSEMPLELLIGSSENRMREGLCYDISLRPFGKRRKIAIIDDADTLNAEGANALLKTLEEPPPDSLLILIATSLQKQLPTIRSRSQTILFRGLDLNQLKELILEQGISSEPSAAAELAVTCDGSISEARQLSDPELRAFSISLLEELAKRPLDFTELTKSCSSQADSAGKEARLKRERLKWILRIASNFYRLVALCQTAEDDVRSKLLDRNDDQFVSAARSALKHWSRGLAGAVACWQICLEATDQVDRNANQATLLQNWTADIAKHSGC